MMTIVLLEKELLLSKVFKENNRWEAGHFGN